VISSGGLRISTYVPAIAYSVLEARRKQRDSPIFGIASSRNQPHCPGFSTPLVTQGLVEPA
jgi:hypothetical protein